MWRRIDEGSGEPVLKRQGVPVDLVLMRLEVGEPPERLAEGMGLDATDVIAALGFAALGPDGSEGPALVQTRPSRPDLEPALTEPALARLVPQSSRRDRLALAAGLLQLHDFWDASHASAQEADDLGERGVSAYWHGIAHRREPDPGNATYWFRRVGRHPAFVPLLAAARPILLAQDDRGLRAWLDRPDGWDPFAFIDLCNAARPGSVAATLARRLQRLELKVLLEATWAAPGLGVA
jgi:uncharacterized protein (DUF433 family)